MGTANRPTSSTSRMRARNIQIKTLFATATLPAQVIQMKLFPTARGASSFSVSVNFISLYLASAGVIRSRIRLNARTIPITRKNVRIGARTDPSEPGSLMPEITNATSASATPSARADSIEAAAAHAIYSDDDDAIPRLRERIAGWEAERARIKAYNASCRKGARNVELLDEKQQAELASSARVAPYQLRDNGAAPAYWSANLSGNIGRQRKRLEQLERRACDHAVTNPDCEHYS